MRVVYIKDKEEFNPDPVKLTKCQKKLLDAKAWCLRQTAKDWIKA